MGHLPENGCVTGGRILINGENVVGLDEPGLRRLRRAAVALVYQDPAAALNPVMTIGPQLKAALDAHRRLPAATARADILQVLAPVRLPAPPGLPERSPHPPTRGQPPPTPTTTAHRAAPPSPWSTRTPLPPSIR